VDLAALASLSARQPVLLICLRHLGCTFSRQTLADLREQRPAIEARGARLAIVHLEPPSIAEPWLAKYGLADIVCISDPYADVYESCGLERGRTGQLVGPGIVWRWLRSALVERHGAGWTGADIRRMPGAFLVHEGQIVRAYRHLTTADRPDYVALCSR
jgi:hypothetical protein